jgi:predicted dehydrogenase
MKKINVAVIGIGNLGQHHARIYYSIKDIVNLVSIVDVDKTKIEKYKKLYPDVEFCTDYKKIIDKVDAVSLVVPTKLHYHIAKNIILAKKHVLVEKPITTTIEEAEELVTLAEQNNVVLQVGHVERFNPVVQAIKDYVYEPKFIESIRLSSFDPRVGDIGVVLDLMIHDIDIILSYTKSNLKSVEAYGAKVFTDKEDIVKARLRFNNGCICDLTASRISLNKYRKMHVFQSDSYISVDFMRQNAKVYKKVISQDVQKIELIKPKIKKDEPLKLELQSFINSIIENKKPVVTGYHAKQALSIAIEITKQLKI